MHGCAGSHTLKPLRIHLAHGDMIKQKWPIILHLDKVRFDGFYNKSKILSNSPMHLYAFMLALPPERRLLMGGYVTSYNMTHSWRSNCAKGHSGRVT
jgi:hypothetical protein